MKQTDRLSLQSLFRPLSVLLLHLILTHFCKGESQLIGPPHSIVAAVGDDIILPCHLKPEKDLTEEVLEWKRSDRNPRFVHVRRDGQDLENVKNPSYRGRTSLFTDELKRGNISLKLSKVQLSDQGIYECDLPLLRKQSSLKLVVASGAIPPPVISLSGIDRESGGVILNCVSKTWHPEPEVLWLDGEGNLLSAGPTETVRGPDDLYTVNSRVTVEKRHSNSFTCRVQQNNVNQTGKTEIYIPDDFFKVQFTYSSITIGLAVSLAVCILLILFLSFLAWKRRQITKTKKSHRDKSDEGERRNHSETNRTEDQFATEEEMTALKGKEKKKSKHSKWQPVSRQRFQEEKQRREEAENKVQILEKELQTKTKELQDEQTRREDAEREVQMKEQELQKKTAELEGNQAENIRLLQQETQEKDKAQREVETLKNQLESKTKELQDEKKKKKEFEEKVETMKEELQNKNTQLEGKQDDIIKQLLQETQENEEAQMEVQTLKNQLEIKKKQVAETKRQLDTKTSEWKKLQTELQDEKKKNTDLEKEMKTLKQELQNKNTQLQDEQTRRGEAERKVQMKEQEPQNKTAELQDEKKRRMGSEEKVKTSQKELKNKITEKNKPEPESSKKQPQQQNSNCLIS